MQSIEPISITFIVQIQRHILEYQECERRPAHSHTFVVL